MTERVNAGTIAYNQAKAKAQHIAQQQRQAGKQTKEYWEDEYNDYNVRGEFIVESN